MRYLFICCLFSLIPFSYAQTDSTCPSDFEGYLTPRLEVGQRVRIPVDVILNLRPQPSLTVARLSALSSGTPLTIIGDAQCVDNFVWWQVRTDSALEGWVAAGNPQDETYYLEPRGELILIENADGLSEHWIQTPTGFLEPEGCMRPPDDYERVSIGFATLNQRTVFMLEQAQQIYEAAGGRHVNFRQLLTQGSYNGGGVTASFGTHDGGGAVDIAVRAPEDFSIMTDELLPMLHALRIAGFAAWVRETGELYDNSPIHIHAIAIGDAEASPIAKLQASGDFGYFQGFNGLPPEEYSADGLPIPDRYGAPILCEWMADMGFEVLGADDE